MPKPTPHERALERDAQRHENRLPHCFHCGGPVHGGPCSQRTAEAAACQACLYRAAEPNGLCDLCQRREDIESALMLTGPKLFRFAAEDIRTDYSPGKDAWERSVADWLDGLADRWSHDATGSEMDAAESVARAYYKGWVKR